MILRALVVSFALSCTADVELGEREGPDAAGGAPDASALDGSLADAVASFDDAAPLPDAFSAAPPDAGL